MKKIITIAVLVGLTFLGCSNESSEYRNFVKKYGSETRTFCDGEFLMRETFLSKDAKAPRLYLIDNYEVCVK